MKVVSSPRNRPAGLSRSQALRRSDQPGLGWLVALRPLERVAIRGFPSLALQIRAGNTPPTLLWVRLSLLVVLAGLWYGVQRTVSFSFMDANLQATLSAASGIFGDSPSALSPANGAAIHPDHLTPDQTVPLSPGPEAPLGRAKSVRISGEDFAFNVRTSALTVQQALAEARITLGPLDRVQPALTTPMTEATDIRVIRVRQYKEDHQEVVPFEYRRVDDPNLPLGLRRQVQYGSPGTLARRIDVRTEDGQVVSRTVAEDRMLTIPRADVVRYGILSLPGPVASLEAAIRSVPGYGTVASGTLAVREVLHVEATGYEPGPRSTGKRPGDLWYGVTSIGWPAVPGIIAVDADIIPYRTRLYVPGYGFGVAGDTGDDIVGHRIDLFYNTEQEALRWGRRTLPVYILE